MISKINAQSLRYTKSDDRQPDTPIKKEIVIRPIRIDLGSSDNEKHPERCM